MGERARKRYCLICCSPIPHDYSKPAPGYVPHWYDPGERRHWDRGRAARGPRKRQPGREIGRQ